MEQQFAPKKQPSLWVDLLFDVAGSILLGLGLITFAKNAGFAPAGLTGLSLIITHILPLPLGITSLLLNIPLLLGSYRVLGKPFLLKSLRTMLISTVFFDLIFPRFPTYHGMPLLAAIFTGILVGAGCALVYMRGSSTGGMDFVILSIKKLFPQFSIGQIILVFNALVVLLGGLVFGSVDAVLYGMIATFLNTMVVDRLMYGVGSGKLVLIITGLGKGAALAHEIFLSVHRGSTLVETTGTFSGEKKDMLLCACSNAQLFRVRAAAYRVDPASLVMITETNEVYGEGFHNLEMEN